MADFRYEGLQEQTASSATTFWASNLQTCLNYLKTELVNWFFKSTFDYFNLKGVSYSSIQTKGAFLVNLATN